jgi:N-acetylmuramoyl-L-alanine amidase
MNKKRCFFVLLLLLAFLPTPAHAATKATPLQVQEIRYSSTGGKTRIVFDLNRKADFRAFLLDTPYRLVVDLPPAAWKEMPSRFISGNRAFSAWRSGALDDGLTRVIFDLRQPMTIAEAFYAPKAGMQKHRLVIDISAASLNAFNAAKARVFGNRNLNALDYAGAPRALSLKSNDTYAAKKNEAIRKANPAAAAAKPVPSPFRQKKTYTVVVDAGHGGGDPGAVAFGHHEKHITLAIARALQRQLEETGRYKVVMTRARDVYIKLHDRLDMSREAKADLFVSIHADKVDRNDTRGASVYTLSETASDAETERLAESENNAGFVAGVDLSQESQDVADILLDLAMREKMNESNMFARMLTQSLLSKNIRLLPNSHRSAGFAVLKAPDVPSVLIETGFLSNPNEAKLLSSKDFQQNIAAAIAGGIDGYFRKMQALQTP